MTIEPEGTGPTKPIQPPPPQPGGNGGDGHLPPNPNPPVPAQEPALHESVESVSKTGRIKPKEKK